MNNHMKKEVFLEEMRKAVYETREISEVDAIGEFVLDPEKPKPQLLPGSVYGFGVCLSNEEKEELFDEASNRESTNLTHHTKFKPIIKNLYPLYWGKDVYIGARINQHYSDNDRGGIIRLSTYKKLIGKTIFCAALTVDNYKLAEDALQEKFPRLLKNTDKQQQSE